MSHEKRASETAPQPQGKPRDPLLAADAQAWNEHIDADGPTGNLRTTLMCAVVIAGMLIGRPLPRQK